MQDRLLGFAGVAIAGGAAAWALAGGAAAPILTLVVIGLMFVLADAAVWRAASDQRADLAVPAGCRLPPAPRSVLVLAAAAIGVVAAFVVDALPVAVALGLVAAAALAGLLRPRSQGVLPARTVRTARRLRAFLRAHGVEKGQPADGYLVTVGESGTRLLIVAPDGAWADAMLAGDDVAAVTDLAQITLRPPNDPVTGQRLRIGPGLWMRMTDSW